jgi:hypothetical protein
MFDPERLARSSIASSMDGGVDIGSHPCWGDVARFTPAPLHQPELEPYG